MKEYHEKNREKQLEKMKQYREKHKDGMKEYNKQYRENTADRLKEHDRVISKVKVVCPSCDKEVRKKYLAKHQETEKCKLISKCKNHRF